MEEHPPTGFHAQNEGQPKVDSDFYINRDNCLGCNSLSLSSLSAGNTTISKFAGEQFGGLEIRHGAGIEVDVESINPLPVHLIHPDGSEHIEENITEDRSSMSSLTNDLAPGMNKRDRSSLFSKHLRQIQRSSRAQIQVEGIQDAFDSKDQTSIDYWRRNNGVQPWYSAQPNQFDPNNNQSSDDRAPQSRHEVFGSTPEKCFITSQVHINQLIRSPEPSAHHHHNTPQLALNNSPARTEQRGNGFMTYVYGRYNDYSRNKRIILLLFLIALLGGCFGVIVVTVGTKNDDSSGNTNDKFVNLEDVTYQGSQLSLEEALPNDFIDEEAYLRDGSDATNNTSYPPSSSSPTTESSGGSGKSNLPTPSPFASSSQTYSTVSPTLSSQQIATHSPTSKPSPPPTTLAPSRKPSFAPTPMPSKRPSTPPTSVLSTPTPSQWPEQPPPSRFPTQKPSRLPSQPPTSKPSRSPSLQPTAKPTIRPTPRPTPLPTQITLRPSTGNPTRQPTNMPSPKPSSPPSKEPSKSPTQKPTTLAPSKSPTIKPSKSPTQKPTTLAPSKAPAPSKYPTLNPSSSPSRSPTPPPSPLPTTRAPTLSYTIKIRATQDTYIDASSMWENFGTSSRLRVDGSPERRTFIGFDTSHLTNRVARHETPLGNDEPRKLRGMQVLEARLRLFSVDDGAYGGGGSVYFLPNTKQWDETLVTATSLGNGVNAAGGFQIASFGDIAAYRWQEIDVTEAFTGGARDFSTFAMTSESSDGVSFASRERAAGMLAPELVLTIAGTGTLAPSSDPGWPTYAPTAILSEDPSPKPSRKPTRKPTPIPTVFDVTTMIPTKEPSSGPTQISTLELTSSPQTTTKVIELDPTLCQTCPTSGTLFVAGSDCIGFWRCADGVRDHYHACPEGTIFNNLLQICDHPYNFTCTCNP
mmetsp:Transcript_20557/g.30958  ORF Transcript_20557/g.30958 Transcript_20557/m.30958 type:complete len:917 (-) Transcript_20557:115-2865(-)